MKRSNLKFTLPMLAGWLLAFASPATAQENFYLNGAGEIMEFTFPADCVIGESCFVTSYVDVDESRRWRDHSCRGLSSNNHKGTDIRLPNIKVMEEGVAVYAMADGTVKGKREGQKDGVLYRGEGEIPLGDECGNALIIDHGNNWRTQYCHLKEGSIRPIRNQKVKEGDKIAEVGMSGDTRVPLLHFEVRNKENTVDPYTGSLATEGCKKDGQGLWKTNVLNQAMYYASGTLNVGVTGQVTDKKGIEAGSYLGDEVTLNSERLSFYMHFFGLKMDDLLEMSITGPDGAELVGFNKKHEDLPEAEHMEFITAQRPAEGWTKGTYTATFNLIRYGQNVISERILIDLPKKEQVAEDDDEKIRKPKINIPQEPDRPSFE